MGVDQVRSGWMMLSALDVREMLPSVNTTDGEYTTVNITRTSLYRVYRQHIRQVDNRNAIALRAKVLMVHYVTGRVLCR